MFREIFSKEEGNHPKVDEQGGQRCGDKHVHGVFMRMQANDDGHIRSFMGSEIFTRVKDSFHKHVKHLVLREHREGT